MSHNLLRRPDMKKQILSALILLILFGIFIALQQITPKKTYTVLNVDNKNLICVDLNRDLKCGKDEKFMLKDIKFFSYDEPDLAYVCTRYLRHILKGKHITFNTNPAVSYEGDYRYAKIFLEDKDIGLLLLKNGLALSYTEKGYTPYFMEENTTQITKNREVFSKLDTRILNTKTKIYHKKSCPLASKIANAEFLPLIKVIKGNKPCSYCNSMPQNEKISHLPDVIEARNPDIISGIIEGYFIDPDKYSRPSKKVRTAAAQALLYNINNAKSSVDIALYGVENQQDIYNALLNARKRGVKVRAVVDSNPNKPDTYYDTKRLRKDFNAVSDNDAAIMHNKFFIFDNQKVMTSTMNISPAGSGGYNSNTALIINSKTVAEVYKREFEQMYSGKFHKHKTPVMLSNYAPNKNTVISVYFSPAEDILSPVKNVINSAKSEILVSAFYLTHKDVIAGLIEAKQRGVKVLVVVDALGASNFKDRLNTLRRAGVKVKVENWGGKNHQKNIAVDSCTFVTGSANFSKNAVINNDENILVIKDCKLTAAYRDYFYKLYNSIDDKYLNLFPQAESLESKNSCYDGIDNDFDGKTDFLDEGCKKHF